jgi:8-oxo-dGTP diphosphatase
MTGTRIMNMCMIQNEITKEVLVQDKASIHWSGVAFCGGHVEDGESIVASTIREVKEESGYDITHLKHCGIVNWVNTSQKERWLIFLYKTSSFNGECISESDEGKVFWVQEKDLGKLSWAPYMESYLRLFFDEDTNEAFASWNDEKESEIAFF